MSSIILGINVYHGDSSVCLIKDGQLLAAVEEERFRRIKHWAGFPSQAIRYCLKETEISPHQIDYIGISRNPKAHLFRKILFALSPSPKFSLIRDRLTNIIKIRSIKKELAKALGVNVVDLKAKFYNIEHHHCHLASSFFVSPFQKTAILSVDGFGDFVSTMMAEGKGNQIRILDSLKFPHSLGLFYLALTQYLGFLKYGDEYKVMALAAYGKPVYLEDFRKILKLKKNGEFELDLIYFRHHQKGLNMTWNNTQPVIEAAYSKKFVEKFGPARKPDEIITEHHQNLAASLQAALEEAYFHILNNLYQRIKEKNLCLAGGVALNSVANGKIFDYTPFKEIYIQPAANDAGTALGAAYYIYHQILNNPRQFIMSHTHWGPQYSNEQIEGILKEFKLNPLRSKMPKASANGQARWISKGVNYQYLKEAQLIEKTAEFIANGKIVGWFQGRMEWGPRALGNRSILADPRKPEMKDILNARIKKREGFRPFAPSILIESVSDFFEEKYPEPFMLKVYPVKKEKQEIIPAVCHIDGTARLQTVSKEENPLYWKLIKEFEKKTGVPVLLNTSFNEQEPIVCSPKEAIECFLRTKMDVLVLGNYLITKEEVP